MARQAKADFDAWIVSVKIGRRPIPVSPSAKAIACQAGHASHHGRSRCLPFALAWTFTGRRRVRPGVTKVIESTMGSRRRNLDVTMPIGGAGRD